MKHTILSRNRLISFAILFSFISLPAWAGTVTTPANLPSYYSGINGKNGTTLWSAVHTVAGTGYSTSISYANVWTVYATTDSYMDGSTRKVYDMYGGCDFTYSSDQCGSYSNECDCYNREHSIPKSWFGGSEAANSPGSDVFHLVPTDGKINNTRSNYAFGEVQTAKTTHNTNGMVNKLSTSGGGKSITIENTMLGTSSTQSPGSGKQVFEPDDIYKGDFARGYFGTLLHWAGDYQAFTTGDGAVMFSGTYTEAGHWGLTPYGIALLLKWHRQDPVSQKEIDRNNGIQQTQGNRNPFIDYPILAEYIWGKYAGETFSLDNAVGSFDTSNFTPGVSDGDKNSTSPTIAVSTTSITMDPTANGGTTAQTFTITGANLTGAISIAKSGSSYITVSPTSITSGYNGTKTITVTYKPTATGSHSATLTISSTGATSKTVTVSGTCTTVYNVTWMADGSSYHSNTAASGNKPTLPSNNPDDCSVSRVFMGWTASSSVSSEPADLFTDQSGAPNITTNKTFYAVYADKSTSGGGSGSTTTLTMSTYGATSGTFGAFTFATAQNGGTSAPTYNTTGADLRLYASNQLTISTSSAMTQIVFNLSTQGMKRLAPITADAGSIATQSSGDATVTWTGSATSVTFTVGAKADYGSDGSSKAGQLCFNSVDITTGGGGSTTYSNYSLTCSVGPTVTITFHSNYGSETTQTQVIPQSTNTALIANTFTRTNYTFAGWATSANGSVVYADEATVNFSTDKDLYARWTEDPQYTVTFMNNGSSFATKSSYAGATITGVATPTACDGYTFEGWSTHQYAEDNTAAPAIDYAGTIPAANTTYYAVYRKTEGSGNSSTSNITASNDLVSGTTTSGYTFATAQNGGSSSPTYNATGGDVRLYAKNQITISASSSITQIVFNISTQGLRRLAPITASAGTIASQASGDNTVTWTGSATSITFTVGNNADYGSDGASKAGQLCFTSVDITSGSGSSTTYHTTAPNCTCEATLTVRSEDDTMGTVGIE